MQAVSLTTLGLVAQAVTGVASAISQYQAERYNARVARQMALAAQRQAAWEERQKREEARRLLARQRALYGKAGVAFAGSPLEVFEETVRKAELDAMAIRYAGAVEAGRARSMARWSQYMAGQRLLGGLAGTGTTLLTQMRKYGIGMQ